MMRAGVHEVVLIACGLALVLAACAPRREAPPPSALEDYKRAVALDVLQHQPSAYCQPGDEMLKSVVILEIAIDGEGRLLGASVVRSNGHPELAQRAVDTVRAAAPFTAPVAGQGVQFLETFLFRDDECFQIRSLVAR
jgi:TonB family protein